MKKTVTLISMFWSIIIQRKKKKSKFQNVAELLSTLPPQKWYQFRNHEIPSQDSSIERGAVTEFQGGDCFTVLRGI